MHCRNELSNLKVLKSLSFFFSLLRHYYYKYNYNYYNYNNTNDNDDNTTQDNNNNNIRDRLDQTYGSL